MCLIFLWPTNICVQLILYTFTHINRFAHIRREILANLFAMPCSNAFSFLCFLSVLLALPSHSLRHSFYPKNVEVRRRCCAFFFSHSFFGLVAFFSLWRVSISKYWYLVSVCWYYAAWMHSAQCTRHILVGYHWKVHSSWTPLFIYNLSKLWNEMQKEVEDRERENERELWSK